MRTIIFIIMGLSLKIHSAQNTISETKLVWRFEYYDFFSNLDLKKWPHDTLYTIQKFPKRNGWKIYYDAKKTCVATVFTYDSIKKILTTRHFQTDGKLTWELCRGYADKKTCNPLIPYAWDLKYLKMFRGDSVVCEMIGQQDRISVKYRDYVDKEFFDQTMFYSKGTQADGYIGSDVWKYYENGKIKTICKTIREDSEEATMLFFECKNFDENGCIIPEK